MKQFPTPKSLYSNLNSKTERKHAVAALKDIRGGNQLKSLGPVLAERWIPSMHPDKFQVISVSQPSITPANRSCLKRRIWCLSIEIPLCLRKIYQLRCFCHQDMKFIYNNFFFFVPWCLCGDSFRFIRVGFYLAPQPRHADINTAIVRVPIAVLGEIQ